MSSPYPLPDKRHLTSPARFLWWLVISQRRRVALGALLGTLSMLGLVLPPYLLSHVINDGLQARRFHTLTNWVLTLLGTGVLTAFVSIMRHRTMTKVRMDAAFRTLNAVVEHATHLGAALTEKVSAGEIATIGIGDIWVIGGSLTIVGPGCGAVIAYAVVAGLLLSVSPLLALIVLLGAPVIAVLIGPPMGRLRRAGTVYREQQAALSTGLVDIVQGLKVLTAVGGKDLFRDRYRLKSRVLREEGYRVGAVSSWIPTLGGGLPLLFLAVVTWSAAHMAADHAISVGDLVAVYGYVAILVVPVSQLIENGSDIARALVAAQRVIALLTLERSPLPPSPSPMRLHDPNSGLSITPASFNAVASAQSPRATAELADRFADDRTLIADNEAHIFAGPLRETISGRFQPGDEAITDALHAAVADDIVAGLPDGLASHLEASGRNLSGGQRQRVRLARALLADPEVLFAIDPTSAVDAHTEALIADRLRAARAGRTTVVTTTSPLLLDRADVVHYLVDGRVVASGTHRELLDAQNGYRDLVSRGTTMQGNTTQ